MSEFIGEPPDYVNVVRSLEGEFVDRASDGVEVYLPYHGGIVVLGATAEEAARKALELKARVDRFLEQILFG